MAVSRVVSLVLVDGRGSAIGALPPFEVDVPYWQEVASVVSGARQRYGVEVSVLRLLTAERPVPPGGAVTYLASVCAELPPGVVPVEVDLADHPCRADYARPGGPEASLRWADSALRSRGYRAVRRAAQQRTWNLSAIWLLETDLGTVWLKQVPSFFAHEPVVLAHLADAGFAVPRLVAAEGGRMLLDHVPGEDLYGADRAVRHGIAADMHAIQVAASGSVGALVDAGVPDRRAAPLSTAVAEVVADHGDGDPRLRDLVAGLDERLAAVAACGLPDTLVHGDLHPGNVRGDEHHRVLIDWGDAFIGHPGFDILRLTEDLPLAAAADLVGAWADRWRATVPGGDPETAIALLRPVAALRNAAVYADFLANIEPAEHPYHAADVGLWLAVAAA